MKKTKILSIIISAAAAVQSLSYFTASAEYYDDANLIISVFNEDEGGFYTENNDFMIVGSQKCAPGQAGAVFLDGFNTSESNPVELTNIAVDTRNTYTIIPSGKDQDGYHYSLDWKRAEPSFTFEDGKDQKIELYMKKFFFVINSEQLSSQTHSEEVLEDTGNVINSIYNVINSYDFMLLDSTQRVNAVDAVLEDLKLIGLVSNYNFNNDEKTMEFTYKCGITGTLRPAVFIGRGETIDDIKPPKKAEHDINCDGDFAVSDVISLQNWLVRNERAAYINYKAADLCPDGKIDVFDLVAAKKEIIGSSYSANDSENIGFELVEKKKRSFYIYYHQYAYTYIVRSLDELNEVTTVLDDKVDDIAGIDEDFFADKALVLHYTKNTSGSVNHFLDRIYSEGGVLKVDVSSTCPEIATCDMVYTRFAAAVEKSAVEGLTTDSPDIGSFPENTVYSDR